MDKLNSLGKILNEISNDILFQIRKNVRGNLLDDSTYNVYRETWERTSFKKELLEPWRDQINIDEISVEIIRNSGDKGQIHYHEGAYAVVTLLGEREHYPEPKGCFYYFGSKDIAHYACSGMTLQILPKVIHGFRSPDGAPPITFLSVQSKKITTDFVAV